MRLSGKSVCLAITVAAALCLTRSSSLHAQRRAMTLALTSGSELRTWDASLDRMARGGDLRLRRADGDTLLTGRLHERMDQYYNGVRVYGADIARQSDSGTTVSIFGTVYGDIDIDVTPRLGVDEALSIVKQASGVDLGPGKQPGLLILPDGGRYRLVYHASVFTASHALEYFIDASDGSIVRTLGAAKRQSAIGTGTGVLGDTKKVSMTALAGAFRADDALRPPMLTTYDMRGNVGRTLAVLNGLIPLVPSDVASDPDNTWTDRADVDAHAYAGYVYDYYFKRFGRKGLDNNNLAIQSLVHPASRANAASQPSSILEMFYLNAFYAGGGVMVYGEGLPSNLVLANTGQSVNYLAGGLDIVGHELTHGVTDYTSGLIYENESGALNESFSDMMGTAIEFFYQPPGTGLLKADYLLGEDVWTPGGLRSLADPGSLDQPDHYSKRVVYDTPTEDNDNGGVHTNSGISNQAYYLAIEGGTNRTSGLPVQGVGQANRDQIEKVMYRAFTQLMPANATFSVARAATIQAARDLFGAGSAPERAVTQAWTAVGVN